MPPVAPARTIQPTASRPAGLRRSLGVAFGVAVTIGSTIGVGILRTPGTIAVLLPDKLLILACWGLAGGYIGLAANSYAELTAMLPHAGGAFNYIRRAFGPFAGFVAGWADYFSNALSPAVFSLILGEYTGLLVPALAPYPKLVGVAYLTTFALLNLPGVRSASVVQQLVSALKIGLLLVLILGCFWAGPAAGGPVPPAPPAPVMGGALVLAFFRAWQLILGTYDGWMAASYFAEEDANPGRNIPRAYFLSVATIIGVYVLLNAALLYVLPLAAVAHAPVAAAVAAAAAFGSWSGPLVTGLSVFFLVGILNALLISPARILFGLSRAGYCSPVAQRLNAGGTPYVALGVGYVLALWGITANSFEQLFALGALVATVVMGGSLAALFRLRATEPALPRPFQAWGYPVVPALALLLTVGLLMGFAVSDPRSLLIIAGVTAISYPAYRLVTRHAAPAPEA